MESVDSEGGMGWLVNHLRVGMIIPTFMQLSFLFGGFDWTTGLNWFVLLSVVAGGQYTYTYTYTYICPYIALAIDSFLGSCG